MIRSQHGESQSADFPAGFQNIDLLWSPDSKAFFVDGGNGGGYWGFWVYVYRLDDPRLEPILVTAEAQRDMVETFPPCKASYLDRQTCASIEQAPDFNMTGIDWLQDSSTLIVMAEIPCTGGYGGIMCQVIGYELSVPTGRILKKMNAREFAKLWQKSMAWKFSQPGPPEYCEKRNSGNPVGCVGHTW